MTHSADSESRRPSARNSPSLILFKLFWIGIGRHQHVPSTQRMHLSVLCCAQGAKQPAVSSESKFSHGRIRHLVAEDIRAAHGCSRGNVSTRACASPKWFGWPDSPRASPLSRFAMTRRSIRPNRQSARNAGTRQRCLSAGARPYESLSNRLWFDRREGREPCAKPTFATPLSQS